MKLSDIDYELPEWAIAQSAVEPRDSARLLVCEGDSIDPGRRVRDLPSVLREGDLLVVNETRVMRSRVFARRETGGRVEVFFVSPVTPESDGWWEALVKPSRRIRSGEVVKVERSDGLLIEIGERSPSGGRRLARFLSIDSGVGAILRDVVEVLDRVGEVPLPPYFKGSLEDESRYQTVYARRAGSAAAPTAGLHFTHELLEDLRSAGIRVATVDHEVGADTFAPVTSGDPSEHHMHSERYRIAEETVSLWRETRREGGRVIAVGTTSLRALESAFDPRGGPGGRGSIRSGEGVAESLIAPGYRFQAVDGLMTNFHAPRTTMIMLLAALYPRWREAYRMALSKKFRFLSFGDSMLVIAGRDR